MGDVKAPTMQVNDLFQLDGTINEVVEIDGFKAVAVRNVDVEQQKTNEADGTLVFDEDEQPVMETITKTFRVRFDAREAVYMGAFHSYSVFGMKGRVDFPTKNPDAIEMGVAVATIR